MFKTAVVFTALAATAVAQSIPNVTSSCKDAILPLAVGDTGSCLSITDLLPLMSADGSLVQPLDTYLSKLCSNSTPGCSNDTLSSAKSSLEKGCAEDMKNPTSPATILISVIDSYDNIYAAACSKNSTTSKFCVTETLETLQTDTNNNITLAFLSGILGGDTSSFAALEQSFQSGHMCTSCVAGIYYEATQINSTLTNTVVGSAVAGQCGADFGKSEPTDVTVQKPGAASGAVPGETTTSLKNGALSYSLAPFAVVGASVVAVFIGAASVF